MLTRNENRVEVIGQVVSKWPCKIHHKEQIQGRETTTYQVRLKVRVIRNGPIYYFNMLVEEELIAKIEPQRYVRIKGELCSHIEEGRLRVYIVPKSIETEESQIVRSFVVLQGVLKNAMKENHFKKHTIWNNILCVNSKNGNAKYQIPIVMFETHPYPAGTEVRIKGWIRDRAYWSDGQLCKTEEVVVAEIKKI